jgi:chromosome segregation ATPase
MNSSKIGSSVKTYGSGPSQPNLDSNYNNDTMISLTTKYNILEDNLNQLLRAMDEHKKDFQNFSNNQDNLPEIIDGKSRQLEDNVGSSITRMDGEIQKSLSHQKAENSRLEQQIAQLNSDEIVIKNQLLAVQKRIDDIQLQIGPKYS